MKLFGNEEIHSDPLSPKHDGSVDVPHSFDEIMHSEIHLENPEQQPHLFEGDIVLSNEQLDEIIRKKEEQLSAQSGVFLRRKRSLTKPLNARWDISRPIPFFINLQNIGVSEEAVLNGIARWEQDTCIRFKRTYNYPYNYNSLVFTNGLGCSSNIGKIDDFRPQPITLASGCEKLGIVAHEIGHALGFYHEQSRYDRDEYVQIFLQNVGENMGYNFGKASKSETEDFGVGYDYGSVMHYEPFAFSIDRYTMNYPTVRPTDFNYQKTIGQRIELSFADVKRINSAYCSSTCPVDLLCEQGGYTDPNDCAKCRCPSGFGGQLCDRAADQSTPVCGFGDIKATENLLSITMDVVKTCNYVITAPVDRHVYFQITSMSGFTPEPNRDRLCNLNYVEIKYGSDLKMTGARFCSTLPSVSISKTNKLVVIYQGNRNTRFTLTYRFDPPTPVPTTEASVTQSPTSPSFTSSPETQATITPYIPIVTYPSPKSIPTVVSTVIQQTVTPTIIQSTESPSLPRREDCSQWTSCSEDCGGCVIKSRTCNGKLESNLCNLKPCSDGSCCRPFLGVQRGICHHP